MRLRLLPVLACGLLLSSVGSAAAAAVPAPVPTTPTYLSALDLSTRFTFVDAPLVFPKRPGRVPGEQVSGWPKKGISEAQMRQLIDAAGERLGIPVVVLDRVRSGLVAVARGESQLFPSVVQQTASGPNGAYRNRARGLFQLVPWLFRMAYVPPFDNIYAPLDNTLAAINIYWLTASQTGLILTTKGDQIDSCGGLMINPKRPKCQYPGVWPQSPGWSAVRFSEQDNPYLSAAQRAFAFKHYP